MRFFISYTIYSRIVWPNDYGKKSIPFYDKYVYYLF